MQHRCTVLLLFYLTASSAGVTSSARAESPLRRIEGAVPGQSAAVVVDDCRLIHTTQILPVDADGRVAGATPGDQVDHVLSRLGEIIAASDTSRRRAVKLNIYVADAATRDLVRQKLPGWFGDADLPAVSYVETALPVAGAKVALDAVIASALKNSAAQPTFGTLNAGRAVDWSELPRGDVVYVSGQAEPGELAEATRETLNSLLRTLRNMQLGRQHIVGLKCFVQPMSEAHVVDRELRRFFGEATIPPVSLVEWSSSSRPIEIELIAYAPPVDATETVSFSAPPWMRTSPVYSRVARIHGNRRIYTSGLYANDEGDGAAQVQDIFRSLKGILASTGSDVGHLAKATYYVSGDDASAQLNAIRPSIYDPKRPPAASKAFVKGVAADRRSITLDMIAAPAP